MEKNYYEVNLISMFLYICRKYKKIIIISIITAGLLGTFGCAKTIIHNSKIVVTEAQQAEYDETIASYDKKIENANKDIEKQNENISNFETYKEESIMYNLDANNTYVYEKYYFVDTNYNILPGMSYQNVNYTNTVGNLYVSFLNEDDSKQQMVEETSIEQTYLLELYTISYKDSLLTLTVYGESLEDCQKIIDVIDNHLTQIGKRISNSIVKHELSIVSTNKCYCYSSYVENYISKKDSLLDSYNTAISKDEKNIETYESQKAAYISDFNANYVKQSVVNPTVKFGLIGLVASLLAMIVFYALSFIFSDKVYDYEELQARGKFVLLSSLNKRGKENKLCSLLSKLENRSYCNDISECCNLAINNIYGLGIKPEKIFVTGDIDADKLEKFTLEINKTINSVVYGTDFLNNSQCTKYFNAADYIVLVVESGVSNYSKTTNEIKKAKETGKHIGCIVID